MEKYSLRTQFVLTFVLILALSLAATAATYLAAVLGYAVLQQGRVLPANYYENQLPTIEQKLGALGAAVFDPASQAAVDALIPPEGMRYQVLDLDGKVLYGSETQALVNGRADLNARINTTFALNGSTYVRLAPLPGADGRIGGAAALVYPLSVTYRSAQDRVWMTLVFGGALLSPFAYILLFTSLLGRRFVRRITAPLDLLTEAAGKIRAHDLDFTISYRAPNELGRLCAAFDEMRLALSESLKAQWHMQQERIEMVEALAHDLKTPLSIVQGYTEALQAGGAARAERLEPYLAVIQENAGKAARQVAQLQYVADLEDAGFHVTPASLELPSFLGDKLDEYCLLARTTGVNVDLRLEDVRPLGGPVRVDREILERVLDNLVINAIHYTPAQGAVNIRVRLTPQRLACSVYDSGPGFSKKDLAHLFDRFYRGEAARPNENGHSGLGLSIARQLVERHGGQIRAANRPEGGACVSFEIALEP